MNWSPNLHSLSLEPRGVFSSSCPRANQSQSHCKFPCKRPWEGTLSLDTEGTEKWLFRTNRTAQKTPLFANTMRLFTFLMVWKTSSTAMGMTPGRWLLPIMVKVFPEDVCPYANIVPEVHTHIDTPQSDHIYNPRWVQLSWLNKPLYPSTVETTRGLAMSWYRSTVVSSAVTTLSVNRQWSFMTGCLGGANKESQQHWQVCFSTPSRRTETKVLGGIPLINQVNGFLISFPEKLDRL